MTSLTSEESAHLFIPYRDPMMSMNLIHVFLHYFCYTIVGFLSSVEAMFQETTELQVYETHLCCDAAGRGRGVFHSAESVFRRCCA